MTAAVAAAVLTDADPRRILGRKGLLGKEPATLLALCAAHRALGLPDGPPALPLSGGDRTAVIACSALGNAQTVATVARTVGATSPADVSILDAPNASSNIVASTLAIRYGLQAANFMLCAGPASGYQAIRIGRLLIATGRADRVLLVGTEPDDPVSARFLPRDGGIAAAVVLTASGPYRLTDAGPADHGPRLDQADVETAWGPSGAATGVLHLACAIERLRTGGPDPVVCTSPHLAQPIVLHKEHQ